MPIQLRRDAGRVAYMHGEALGRWIRELLEREVRAEKLRGALDAAGQLIIRLPVLLLVAMGIAAVIAQALSLDDDANARAGRRRGCGRRRDEFAVVCFDDEEGHS